MFQKSFRYIHENIKKFMTNYTIRYSVFCIFIWKILVLLYIFWTLASFKYFAAIFWYCLKFHFVGKWWNVQADGGIYSAETVRRLAGMLVVYVWFMAVLYKCYALIDIEQRLKSLFQKDCYSHLSPFLNYWRIWRDHS